MTLHPDSVKGCVEWLEGHKKALQTKTEVFVERLAEVGVKCANHRNRHKSGSFGTHYFETRVTFSKEVDPVKFGCKGTIVGEGVPFHVVWDNGNKEADVLPLHILEYGSDHNGSMRWSFVDEKGKVFPYATGVKATQPLYKAYRDMCLQVIDIAKEVYGGN